MTSAATSSRDGTTDSAPSTIAPIAHGFFFFKATATTETYTLSLHDALPLYRHQDLIAGELAPVRDLHDHRAVAVPAAGDRKSTRLNSSHRTISYAVFCM